MDATLLIEMIRTLRGPGGCPWDQKQQLEDLRPYLIEEAHEAAAAIDAWNYAEAGSETHGADPTREAKRREAGDALCAELGDLLFQLCFVAELAHAQGAFSPTDVPQRVHGKMVERHPHVYGDETLETAQEVAQAWEQRKQKKAPDQSVLAGVPTSLPALTSAFRTGQKAAGIGFDWPQLHQVRAKVDEELAELDQAIMQSYSDQPVSPSSDHRDAKTKARVEEELGDVLLTMASLARHLDIDPERALARANLKFRRRFQHIEAELHQCDLKQAEALWDKAKRDTD